MQTVLVAGGAGFLGSHLYKRLLQQSYNVICVDNFSSSSRRNISEFKDNKNFTLVEHDIISPLSEKLKADYIFHLASPASPNHYSNISYHKLALETMLANTTGTYELLKFSEKNKAKFLFASTSEVYGDPQEHPQTEEYRGNVSTSGPRSVYDESKRFGETLTSYFLRERDLDVRIARVFNTYGPGMLKEDMRMIIIFITQALENKPITVFGDGNQTRSLCFISDMTDGLLKLMFNPNTKGEIVNIGSEDERSVLEYASLVKQLTNSSSEVIFSEELPKDDPYKRKPDISKVQKLLEWSPRVGLEEGILKTIEYFRKL